MTPPNLFDSGVAQYLEKHGSRVSAAGIRYGSILYLAFGQSRLFKSKSNIDITVYDIEIEIGSDNWAIYHDKMKLIDSDFLEIDIARNMIESTLIGRKLLSSTALSSDSVFQLDGGIELNLVVADEPASGFLYSFSVEGGPTWETLDGLSRSA